MIRFCAGESREGWSEGLELEGTSVQGTRLGSWLLDSVAWSGLQERCDGMESCLVPPPFGCLEQDKRSTMLCGVRWLDSVEHPPFS